MIIALSQFLQMCRNIRIKFLSWAYMYTTVTFLGKRVIQTNPSKFDERLFSETERQRQKQRQRDRETERQRQTDRQRQRQRDRETETQTQTETVID